MSILQPRHCSHLPFEERCAALLVAMSKRMSVLLGKKTKTGRPLFNAKFDILPAVDAAVFASRSWPTQDRHLGNFDNKSK